MIADTDTKTARSMTIMRSSKRMAPASSPSLAFYEVANVWMSVVRTNMNEAM